MKKEDFTTRLLKLFFHIQGPFDECRQEMIYKACARALIQIVYSSLLLFLFYLLFGRFIELVRDAMPYLYFGLIFVLSSRARLAVRDLHLDKDDQSEIHHKSYSKSQIKVRSWGCIHQYSNWLVCLISLSQILCSASSPRYLLGQSLPLR